MKRAKELDRRMVRAELKRIAASCERTEELMRTLVNDAQGWLRKKYGKER